jgi:hypothetical protein
MWVLEHKKSGDFSPLLTIKLKNYENSLNRISESLQIYYKFIKQLILVSPFIIIAQPIAGFLPALAYAIAYDS